jgi:hypothetical protein
MTHLLKTLVEHRDEALRMGAKPAIVWALYDFLKEDITKMVQDNNYNELLAWRAEAYDQLIELEKPVQTKYVGGHEVVVEPVKQLPCPIKVHTVSTWEYIPEEAKEAVEKAIQEG